jgi:myo-inositol-1(or 4)-monophosphatase
MDQLALARGQMDVPFQHSVSDWDWCPGIAIVRGVGGVAQRTTAGGVLWSVSGVPTAVARSVPPCGRSDRVTHPTA